MKKLLSLLVVAASLTLFSCESNTVNEHEGTDVDTVTTNTEINNTEINTNTTTPDTTGAAGTTTDTTKTMGH